MEYFFKNVKKIISSVFLDILNCNLWNIFLLIFQIFEQNLKKNWTTLSYSCHWKDRIINAKIIQRLLYFVFGNHICIVVKKNGTLSLYLFFIII